MRSRPENGYEKKDMKRLGAYRMLYSSQKQTDIFANGSPHSSLVFSTLSGTFFSERSINTLYVQLSLKPHLLPLSKTRERKNKAF